MCEDWFAMFFDVERGRQYLMSERSGSCTGFEFVQVGFLVTKHDTDAVFLGSDEGYCFGFWHSTPYCEPICEVTLE